MTSVEETGLYIHIPFCKEKCRYCDFLSGVATEAVMEAYLDVLAQEAATYQGRYRAKTVFIGGGTPSVLPVRLLGKLFRDIVEPFLVEEKKDPHDRMGTSSDALDRSLTVARPVEVTVEANPESFSREKATVFRQEGVNRLSLGVQSFVDSDLKRLGRVHSVEEAVKAFSCAREAGFSSINLDLMYGFPDQTPSNWSTTLDKALDLGPEHLSTYCFTLEEGSRFHLDHEAGLLPREDDSIQAEMYESCRTTLTTRGFVHYELSNFARPGHECRHNLRYWQNNTYLGLGVGATSFLEGRRRSNATGLEEYRRQIREGRRSEWMEEPLSAPQRVRESLILGLRLLDGVDPANVPGNPIEESEMKAIHEVLSRWQERGLLKRSDDRFAFSERGLFLSNEVLGDLV